MPGKASFGKAIFGLEYLRAPAHYAPKPVCVLFGQDAFLKRQITLRLREEVLGTDDGEMGLVVLEAKDLLLRDVLDELALVGMFGTGKRMVLVREADEFVTRYRTDLEAYVVQPKPSGVLVLDVKQFAATTRLYAAVVRNGLALDCSPPAAAMLSKWVTAWAKQHHGAELTVAAGELLVELLGPELGLLDQELAKLAVAVRPGEKIGPEVVRQWVGTWRTKTTWDMLDAALGGKSAEALAQLDRLLLAGEQPVLILAQIAATLRRLAAATRVVLEAESRGQRIPLREALRQAGVKEFLLGKYEQQLRTLGRHRGARLCRWLLQADLDLKGASSLPPRLVMERLLVAVSAPEMRT